MNPISQLAVFVFLVILSWLITGRAYRFALQHAVIDHPNQRSLHSEPTPRGGGVSIVMLCLGGTGLLWREAYLSGDLALAILCGGGLVALIGWIDDRTGFPTLARGFLYLLAAAGAVAWIGTGDGLSLTTHFILFFTAVIGLAWLTNLYNFMDGSDGIAALEAMAAGIMAAILLGHAGATGLAWLCAIIVAASTGFLMWNWPPARIFMGDVGSCLLGFLFGLLAIYTALNGILPISVWLILLSVFICDASLTLIKRMTGGEKWYRAHRQHAYQRFIQLGNSHAVLNYHVLAINMLIVYPMVCLAYFSPRYQWPVTAAVYMLLTGIWLFIQIKYGKRPGNKA